MKKYKLIKEYTGSPEFCEGIIEKDYKILSFIDITDATVMHRRCDSIIFTENGCPNSGISESVLLNSSSWNIYSIKRLSDGEVFTVGDKVRYNFSPTYLSLEIKKIAYEKVGKIPLTLYIYTENGSQATINNYAKAKLPLFTTEDGVDIFEGDKTCWINNWIVTNFTDWKRNNNTKELHFSTKKSAEEYILMNKPCLSIKEVLDAYGILEGKCPKLVKIVKSKL